MSDGTTVNVYRLPECDVHRYDKDVRGVTAHYDARSRINGKWGYMCEECFAEHGCELGLGSGQRLVAVGAP